MSLTVKGSVVLASAWGATAMVTGGNRGFLASSGGMRPDVVAAMLVKVEDEWVAQATSFVECSESSESGLNCGTPGKAFTQSCDTIVSAVVQGSSGDRDHVSEYMSDVCKEPSLDNDHRSRCKALSTLMVQQMSGEAYANRENFDAQPLCTSLWESVSTDEKVSIDKRRAEEAKADAEHKKAEEEAAKKRQAEEDVVIAAAAKKAEEAAEAEQKAVVAAKAAEESAKKQVQKAAVASVAKASKKVAIANATEHVVKKAPPAAAKMQKSDVAKVQKPVAKAGAPPSQKKAAPAAKAQKPAAEEKKAVSVAVAHKK